MAVAACLAARRGALQTGPDWLAFQRRVKKARAGYALDTTWARVAPWSSQRRRSARETRKSSGPCSVGGRPSASEMQPGQLMSMIRSGMVMHQCSISCVGPSSILCSCLFSTTCSSSASVCSTQPTLPRLLGHNAGCSHPGLTRLAPRALSLSLSLSLSLTHTQTRAFTH